MIDLVLSLEQRAAFEDLERDVLLRQDREGGAASGGRYEKVLYYKEKEEEQGSVSTFGSFAPEASPIPSVEFKSLTASQTMLSEKHQAQMVSNVCSASASSNGSSISSGSASSSSSFTTSGSGSGGGSGGGSGRSYVYCSPCVQCVVLQGSAGSGALDSLLMLNYAINISHFLPIYSLKNIFLLCSLLLSIFLLCIFFYRENYDSVAEWPSSS